MLLEAVSRGEAMAGEQLLPLVYEELFSDDGCAFNLARLPIGASDFALDGYSLDDTPGDLELKNFSILAIGVLCDDHGKFDEAVEYFKNGKGVGGIKNAVPFRYPGGLGQWQESGRDQAHTMGGQGLLSEFCQVAWNQGLDLFGYNDNALLAGAEYTAQYTLWQGVPYTCYTNASNANLPYISTNYHGRLAAGATRFINTGLKDPGALRYRLRACNTGGYSAYTDAAGASVK